jgi:hypothetical protein
LKVLFLDIDGVLNSRDWYLRRDRDAEDRPLNELDPDAVRRLERLLQETSAKVVVSSTWRILHKLPTIWRLMRQKGLSLESARLFLDKTPVSRSRFRGEEIQEWLRAHEGEIEGYAIVDDDSDMLEAQKPHFVKTSHDFGLQDADVEALKACLSKKPSMEALGQEVTKP